MSVDNVDASVKIIVVGNGGVGKTSMLRRFCKGDFTQDYKKTIGTDFMEKNVYSKHTDQVVNLMLWDTAGQEVFNALTAAYYRGSGGCVLAFSTVDRDSFMAVEKWKDKVEAQCGKGNVQMVIVQTKVDLMETSAVSNAETEALAKKLNIAFFRISTKDNFNVANVFEYLAERCMAAGQTGDSGATILAGGGARITQGRLGTMAAKEMASKPGDPKSMLAGDNEENNEESRDGKVNMNKPKTKRAASKRGCTIL